MRVTVTDVTQRFTFETGAFTNQIVLQLPSGRTVTASVDDDTVAAVIAESQGVVAPGPAPSHLQRPAQQVHPAAPSQQEFEAEQFEEEIAPFLSKSAPPDPVTLVELDSGPQPTDVGDWPERQLDHHVESGMVEWETLPDTQLPPTIKNVLRASQIAPMISIEDLDQLKLEISTHMAKKPKAGQVNWDSGPRRRVETARRLSVQMDDAGNPVPPGGIIEMQPSLEQVTSDEEDGVQQA